jgi:hypothetical protein
MARAAGTQCPLVWPSRSVRTRVSRDWTLRGAERVHDRGSLEMAVDSVPDIAADEGVRMVLTTMMNGNSHKRHAQGRLTPNRVTDTGARRGCILRGIVPQNEGLRLRGAEGAIDEHLDACQRVSHLVGYARTQLANRRQLFSTQHLPLVPLHSFNHFFYALDHVLQLVVQAVNIALRRNVQRGDILIKALSHALQPDALDSPAHVKPRRCTTSQRFSR